MKRNKFSDDVFCADWTGYIKTVARRMASTYDLTTADTEDLQQAAFVRLVSLPRDKRKHRPYIITTIFNAQRTALEKIRTARRRSYFSYDDFVDAESENTYDHVDEKQNVERDSNNRLMARQLLKVLDVVERQMVEMNMGFDGQEPLTHKEIARLMGMKASEVSATLRRCVEQMRRHHETTYRLLGAECLICGDHEMEIAPVSWTRMPTQGLCLRCGRETPNRYRRMSAEVDAIVSVIG